MTCNSTCAICNGTTKACDGCQSGQHINGLGCSPCGKMMWNNITRGTTCQACTGCQECDPTNGHCTMCQWNEGINSTTFQCKSCTAGEWSNPTGVACVKCDLSNGCKKLQCELRKMGGAHININGIGCENCTQMTFNSNSASTTCSCLFCCYLSFFFVSNFQSQQHNTQHNMSSHIELHKM